MKKETRLDMIAASFTLIFGIAILILSTGIEVKAKNGDVGSAFLPVVIGWMMVVLSIIYGVSALLEGRRAGKAAVEVDEQEILKTDNKKIFLSFILMVSYAVLLKPIGFLISSILYLFLQINVMTDKPTAKQRIFFAVLSIIVSVLINYIFVNWFSMALPDGILG